MFSFDIKSIVEESPEVFLLIPAFVFGYLFYLTSDFTFFQIATLWAVSLSLIAGLTEMPDRDEDEPVTDEEKSSVAPLLVVFLIYSFWIGPLAILAASNNLLPESKEIPVEDIVRYLLDDSLSVLDPFFFEVVQGNLTSNDPILLLLFGAQIMSYTYLSGPFVLSVLSDIIHRVLKLIWAGLQWVF